MTFNPTTLVQLLTTLKGEGFSVHVAPHFDGADEPTWQYTIFDHPATYIAKFQQICSTIAQVPGSVQSIELWNEAVDTRTNWQTYQPLYAVTAPALVTIVHQTLPGVKAVLPLPIDQSPEQADFFLGGKMVPMSCFAIADEVSGHVYPTDHFRYPYPGSYAIICNRRDILRQAAAAAGKPLIITELGVAASSLGPDARMADTVKAYDQYGIKFYLWVLHGNPGQYDLYNNPSELVASGG